MVWTKNDKRQGVMIGEQKTRPTYQVPLSSTYQARTRTLARFHPGSPGTSSRRMAPAASTVTARAARWRSVGESEGRGPPFSAQDIQKMLEERGVTSKWARDIGIGSKFEE